MRRILFVLVLVIAVAGVVAYMAPHLDRPISGQGTTWRASLLREVQRSPLSIPSREMVQVETLIPAGVESDGTSIREKRSATSSQARSR